MHYILFFCFFTASIFAQSFKFAALSDSRGTDNGVNSVMLSKLVNHLVANHPDVQFVLFPGDLVDGSKTDPNKTLRQLEYWKKIMEPIYNAPNMIWPKLWITVGNHEVQHRDDEANFKRLFNNVFMNGPDDEKGLTYSFDYQNAHFVFVTTDRWYYGNLDDTTDDKRDWHYIKHLDWLRNDLASAKERGIQWIFILSHEPAFPIGGHLRDALPNLGLNFKLPADSSKLWYLKQRDKFWDICKEFGVTAYICGHEHIYGRQSVDGIHQIIVGSSGAPLYFFNPRFVEVFDKAPGKELSYEDAIPYYQILNYHYGEGKNSQASEDFVGHRAFEYITVEVFEDKAEVTTYGCFPNAGSYTQSDEEIRIIDSFTIKKK